ncbi:hypothetical protein [Haloplanus salilacus]|uniref:hypothetical protein n=1 Tax=Haloplanus salilacus TaxID=2949994 RepID=UPI0030CB6173
MFDRLLGVEVGPVFPGHVLRIVAVGRGVRLVRAVEPFVDADDADAVELGPGFRVELPVRPHRVFDAPDEHRVLFGPAFPEVVREARTDHFGGHVVGFLAGEQQHGQFGV